MTKQTPDERLHQRHAVQKQIVALEVEQARMVLEEAQEKAEDALRGWESYVTDTFEKTAGGAGGDAWWDGEKRAWNTLLGARETLKRAREPYFAHLQKLHPPQQAAAEPATADLAF